LDFFPPPAFEKLDLFKYNYPLQNGLKCINLLTSRGCPFSCQYCSTSKTKLRYHSPDRVIQMAETLKSYGFNSFMMADDNMSMNKKRFHTILSLLEGLNVKWRSLIRAETIDDDTLDRVVRSGCVEIGPGIESGSQRILDIVKKKSKVERNLDFIHRCENAGIRCVPSFIIGLPGEDKDSIQATYEFMKAAKPRAFAYNILMPFPDSPIFLKKDTEFKDLITIYPYTWDDCMTKSKKITQCFISTPSLSREKILSEYYKYYDIFADMTFFDPRRRGARIND
jgi:anaerobic magnesium-protoporphyrin IX monomethyl ester cyclase